MLIYVQYIVYVWFVFVRFVHLHGQKSATGHDGANFKNNLRWRVGRTLKHGHIGEWLEFKNIGYVGTWREL